MSPQDSSSYPAHTPHHALSRRDFIRLLGIGLASAGLAGVDARQVFARGGTTGLEGWNASTFAAQLGKPFTVNLGSAGSATLLLSQVKDGVAKIYHGPNTLTSAPAGHNFVLVFTGPEEPALTSQTYTFQQSELGAFSLFIDPTSIGPTGRTYVAVINHIHA